ncbi:phosphoribosyl-AMP cyclohydrolase [Rhodopseudomonas parapalustris]
MSSETRSTSSPVVADDIEEGVVLRPKFDSHGLVTCVATDARTGDVLMVAFMNDEALDRTIQTGEAWYYSRSRKRLWKKGETSGHVQKVLEMRVDCDQDAVWIKVDQTGGAACHTGRHSCFYRRIDRGGDGVPVLIETDGERKFDPDKVYGK